MIQSRITVESGLICVAPSLADMLRVRRLGGRFNARMRRWEFAATHENAAALWSAIPFADAAPEFNVLIAAGSKTERPEGASDMARVSPDVARVAPQRKAESPVPAGIRTHPWRHQLAAFEFCMERFERGQRGILLAMGMGCVAGDAEVIVNRGGNARRMTLREFHRKFHGGASNKRRWRKIIARTRSVIGGELRLNTVIDVLARGVRPVVKLTLASGKSIRVTPDHEIAQPDGRWTAAERLVPGDSVLTEEASACAEHGGVHNVPAAEAVLSVCEAGEVDVYDLRMAAPGHNFVANGIIVHNCGKSLVACMLALALKARRVLIAAPLRVLPVWVSQFERHVSAPVLVVPLGDDAGSVAHKMELAREKAALAEARGIPFIAVINYESAWRDPFARWAEKTQWDLVVGDEFHRAKGPGGKASLFFKRLRTRAAHRIALTGTPMPHGPMDVYAQFRFLDISVFGPSFSAFRTRYAVMGGFQRKQITGFQHLDELEAKMSRITFRVGAEVLDLPAAVRVTYTCDLTPEAARIYRDLEQDFVARVLDGTVTAANAMVKLLRLQQVTGGCVPTDDGVAHRIDSGKQKLLADTLEDIGGEPVVVFCRFHADLDAVHEACAEMGIPALELSGRRDELKRWQGGEGQVLAVQISAGGIGVDLTRARYSIYYSLSFSLGEYDQALARVHRPGQTRPVEHIHLVARNTVDVKIMRALEKRAEIVQAILAEIKH